MFSDEQNNIDRRRFPRVDFREPIQFDLPTSSASGGCLGRDISEGGLRINFEYFVKPNTVMNVQFRLAPGQGKMTVEGRIAWARQVPSSDRYQLGVEFLGENEDNQKHIRRYVISNHIK